MNMISGVNMLDREAWQHVDWENPIFDDKETGFGSSSFRGAATKRFGMFIEGGYSRLSSPLLEELEMKPVFDLHIDDARVSDDAIIVARTGSLVLPEKSLDSLASSEFQTQDLWITKAQHENGQNGWVDTQRLKFIEKYFSVTHQQLKSCTSYTGDVIHMGRWLGQTRQSGLPILRYSIPAEYYEPVSS